MQFKLAMNDHDTVKRMAMSFVLNPIDEPKEYGDNDPEISASPTADDHTVRRVAISLVLNPTQEREENYDTTDSESTVSSSVGSPVHFDYQPVQTNELTEAYIHYYQPPQVQFARVISGCCENRSNVPTGSGNRAFTTRNRRALREDPSCSLPALKIPPSCSRRRLPSASPDEAFTYQDEIFPTPLPRRPHSNKPYTQEEVDWLRYNKDDLGRKWETMVPLFKQQFPGRARDSDQCLSSRYYRSNYHVLLDENDNAVLDMNGKPQKVFCKVRERKLAEMQHLPCNLYDKHPERAITYSWVNEEHKAIARQILRDRDCNL